MNVLSDIGTESSSILLRSGMLPQVVPVSAAFLAHPPTLYPLPRICAGCQTVLEPVMVTKKPADGMATHTYCSICLAFQYTMVFDLKDQMNRRSLPNPEFAH